MKKSKVYAYLRHSTDKQTNAQQLNFINNYCNAHGMAIDEEVRDDAVSGGVSYKERNLNELFKALNEGDTLIVSELSRLTRGGIVELSDMVNKFFSPRKIRLIIVNVNLDIDCTDITPMTELMLSMMATFAKMEKQSIKERTKSALEARKRQIEEQGFFISKAGNKRTRLGNPKGVDITKAITASAINRRAAARAKQGNKIIWAVLCDYVKQNNGKRPTTQQYEEASRKLNLMGVKTSTGLEMTPNRCRGCYHHLKETMRGGVA